MINHLFAEFYVKKTLFSILKGKILKADFSNLWNKIAANYNDSNRHYHNFSHIKKMIKNLKQFSIADEIIFAAIFHDVIYNPKKNDNEELSALFMEQQLSQFLTSNKIKKISELILSTKNHKKTNDFVTNIFLDSDMSILGSKPLKYKKYCKQIKAEFNFLSDYDFYNGRLAFLQNLDFPVFNTDEFSFIYEKNAFLNISKEIIFIKQKLEKK